MIFCLLYINYTNDCPGVRVGVDRMTVTATMTPIGWDGPCPPCSSSGKKEEGYFQLTSGICKIVYSALTVVEKYHKECRCTYNNGELKLLPELLHFVISLLCCVLKGFHSFFAMIDGLSFQEFP